MLGRYPEGDGGYRPHLLLQRQRLCLQSGQRIRGRSGLPGMFFKGLERRQRARTRKRGEPFLYGPPAAAPLSHDYRDRRSGVQYKRLVQRHQVDRNPYHGTANRHGCVQIRVSMHLYYGVDPRSYLRTRSFIYGGRGRDQSRRQPSPFRSLFVYVRSAQLPSYRGSLAKRRGEMVCGRTSGG